MDYEKKYNEALAWMRELYPGLHGATKEDAEHYFPELRESEDERIRKEIIDWMKGGNTYEWQDNKDRWIAYLERKKEQQPAEWSEDYDEENLQTRFAFYTYKDDPSVLYLSNVFVEETSRNHGFGTRILKAAEKVAEAIGAITIRLKVKQDSPANNWYRKHGYAYMTFEDGYDWLEKNLEYMKPNKQEWSEEDADILNCCISSIEEAKENRYAYKETDGDTSYDREIDWLKSLRPVSKESLQPQQNMSIGFMLYLDEHRPEGKMSLSNAECEDIDKAFKENDWAKIMRYVEKYQPHWKPSEEQMKALERTTRLANFALEEDRRKALVSLHEHLKNL